MSKIEYKTFLETLISQQLATRLTHLALKGTGMCNNAWIAIAENGTQYLIKQERENRQGEEENDLLKEAKIIQLLHQKNPALPIPQVVFLCEVPKMYAYHYIEGEMMRVVWSGLSEQARVNLYQDLGKFHFDLEHSLSQEEITELGLKIEESIEEETQGDIHSFVRDRHIPIKYKDIVQEVYHDYLQTNSFAYLALCHNDTHYENILVHEGKLACIIDFGDAIFADIHCTFTRHFQDYPDYFEFAIQSYEELSQKKLSKKRIIAQAILESIDDFKEQRNWELLETYWKRFVMY